MLKSYNSFLRKGKPNKWHLSKRVFFKLKLPYLYIFWHFHFFLSLSFSLSLSLFLSFSLSHSHTLTLSHSLSHSLPYPSLSTSFFFVSLFLYFAQAFLLPLPSSLHLIKFHQRFTRIFYVHRSQKCKNGSQIISDFLRFWYGIYVQAARETLVKLTPGFNFTNILKAAFALKNPKCAKKTLVTWLSFCPFEICTHKKLLVNMLKKLTPSLFICPFFLMVSISSTFYVQIFCTNMVLAAFSSYILALSKNLYEKCAGMTLMKLTNGRNQSVLIIKTKPDWTQTNFLDLL